MKIETNSIDVKDLKGLVTDEKERGALSEILTQAEAAKYLSVSQTTLVTWGKAGVVKPIRVVGRVYYLVSDLKMLFNEQNGGLNG